MKFENTFKAYLSTNPSALDLQLKDDVVEANLIGKQPKILIKAFWRKKKHAFYKEAHFWRVLSKLTTSFWIIFSVIGLTLIGLGITRPSAALLAVGSIIFIIAILISWSFGIFMVMRKPSYYFVVLRDTEIKNNWKAAIAFYFLGFTALMGMALIAAIQKEMVLLTMLPEKEHLFDNENADKKTKVKK